MGLVRSRNVYGYTTVPDQDPRIETHQDVLYVPFGIDGATPGIYDRGRSQVAGSGLIRGVPNMHFVHGQAFSSLDPDKVTSRSDREDLVFCGHIDGHYGHYIVSSLSRLWWMSENRDPGTKLLVLNQKPLDALFARPFVRDTLAQLGLNQENFIAFDRPTRLRRLVVPSPSFEENNLAYRVFARLCNRIGAALTADLPVVPDDRPIYLSKAKVATGVSTIINEEEFCEALEQRGVQIVHPEGLDLAEQIKLFRDRPVVAGTTGSAMHTGIFVPRNRIVTLNHGENIWSNQVLIDKINDNNSLYLHPMQELIHLGGSDRFGNNFRLGHPRRLAAEFFRALEAFSEANGGRRRGWDLPRSDEADIRSLRKPLGCNLARRKPARQSSICEQFGSDNTKLAAAGAVSGLLTGSYQFHTALQDQPWWQVDLQSSCRIAEIRIHNRLDNASFRSNRLRLLLSDDGVEWQEVLRREGTTPFGGLDGDPLIWAPSIPPRARYVRLQLLDCGILHLDQVEIFGWD